MKGIKWGQRILMFAFLSYIIYNTYYGWNQKPINDVEEMWDTLASWLFRLGAIIYMMPIFSLYEDAVKRKYLRNKAYKDDRNGE